MRIVNLMFGRGLGGIEQAFIDYCEGLRDAGHFVAAVTHPTAAINDRVARLGISHLTQSNWGQWDTFASRKLGVMLRTLRADVVIAHGNRAILLGRRAAAGYMPLIAVAHNYHFQHLEGADAVFAITRHIAQDIHTQVGIPYDRIYHVPNMVRVGACPAPRPWNTPPMIGAFGRFVEKKGFDIYLRALCNLHHRGFAFRARLGGEGEMERELKRMCRSMEIEHLVEFTGWVEDTPAFLESLDIFCLPSHHEPFGIALLEAMSAGLPVISTATEGPGEILQHGVNGLLIPKGSPVALMEHCATLLQDEESARILGSNAYQTVKHSFALEAISANMGGLLAHIKERYVPAALPGDPFEEDNPAEERLVREE